MKIYTKTGDQGKTSLLSGERVFKDCLNLKVVGELDELNSTIGLAVSQAVIPAQAGIQEEVDKVFSFLKQIQRDLFKLGSEIASIQNINPKPLDSRLRGNDIADEDTKKLESEIDKMWNEMPKLKNFILPGGSEFSAYLHLARAVCRRAERALIALSKKKKVRPEVFKYLNRLSDYLFCLARYINFKLNTKDIKI